MASLLKFFSLTYLLTWTCFIAFAMLRTSDGRALTGLSWLLLFVGIFAPGIVALWLTAQAEGRAGLLALLRRLFEWRVGVRWYVFAIGYMAAVKLTVALVHRIAMGAWPLFGPETRHGAWYDTWYAMLAATIFSTAIGGQAGEEIGWRGYALPRLAARLGLARASIPLGIIWACWHLPLFFIPGADTFGESFPVYLLSVTALSVAMAWLYGHTNGSLLLMMLMHAAVNNTKDIVPSGVASPGHPFTPSASFVAWLTVVVLWLSATYFLIDLGARKPVTRT